MGLILVIVGAYLFLALVLAVQMFTDVPWYERERWVRQDPKMWMWRNFALYYVSFVFALPIAWAWDIWDYARRGAR